MRSVPKFGTRKAVKMGLHSLLEKDLKEGKELMEICENLSEEDRLLAQIYILVQRIINNCYIKPMPLPLH